ncbi:MAG: M14 family zinc carboxypeptidase [Balneolaceae bacterium]
MFVRISLSALLLLVVGAACQQALGQTGFMPDEIDYNPQITTPAEAIGHELGKQTVRYDQIIRYFETLSAQSDRVSMEIAGYSVEGRPIAILAITSPQNHENLEQIRQEHLMQYGSNAPDDSDVEDTPVITWLGFGVHGAEAAGLEASIPTVYHLAAGEGPVMEQVLQHSVVLVVAAMNPDGHARRINHSLRFTSNTVVRNGDHAGHELWTRQRTNHYGFDLNRQWLLVNQQEANVWVPLWHRWKPNFSADFHEMGTTSVRPSTYYFPPGNRVRTNRVIPEELRPLKQRFADYYKEVHDQLGTLYFTEEVYDNFYTGTGSAYPDLYGSSGALFEAGTAHLVELDTPLGRWSLADNIELHFRSALASVLAAVELRDELKAYRNTFFDVTQQQARRDEQAAFLFTSPDRSRVADFIRILNIHEIDVYSLARDFTADGQSFSAGKAWLVPVEQDAYRMIRSIFDRVTDFEEPGFSDVTAWTLPLSYNLDYTSIDRSSWSTDLLGEPVTSIDKQQDLPERAGYGYIFSWDDHFAPRALYRLLDRGVIARAVQVPIEVATARGEQSFGRGSIFIPLRGQTIPDDDLYELMSGIAEREGIGVHALHSGTTGNEGADFGSGRAFGTLERPEVLLLFDDGIQHFDMGHIWHLLDVEMEMPVVLKQKNRIHEINWSRYSHIILPGGWDVSLSESATTRLTQWIREEGGTFIALVQAAEWAQEALLGQTPQTDRTLQGVPGIRFDADDLRARESEDVVSGAIFAGDLDISHPIGFGFQNRTVPSYRNTSIVLATPDNPIASVIQYHEEPLLAGYASERRQREIGGSPMLIAERFGAGSIILMTDNPTFRGAWPGTGKLLMNSLFFSKLFSTPRNPGGARIRR